TEPVMYVYQRSLLLACFFSLLALLALQKDRKWLMIVFFVAAFESKESALAIPILVAILDRIRTREAAVPERSERVSGRRKNFATISSTSLDLKNGREIFPPYRNSL